MGIFLTLLQYGLGLLPSIVLGIQTVAGDKQSGATKLQMAQDSLKVALQGATGVIADPTQAALATAAAGAVSGVLAATGAINAAVTHTKSTGQYQAATAQAATLQGAPSDASTINQANAAQQSATGQKASS